MDTESLSAQRNERKGNSNQGRGAPSHGGRGGRGGGRGRIDRQSGEGSGLPVLRYGATNNFTKFKECMSSAALEKFGALGTLIKSGKYYVPPPVDTSKFDLANDPHGLNMEEMKAQRSTRAKLIAKMEADRFSLYGMIWGKLSIESKDELMRHPAYEVFNRENDPLQLWLAIEATHKLATQSKVECMVKSTARENYATLRQGAYESIIAYKERFNAALQAYNDQDNPPMDPQDVAIDFLNHLDDTRYAEFKVDVINDMAKGIMRKPQDLNEIYIMASQRLTTSRQGNKIQGASFVTRVDKTNIPRKQKKEQRPNHKSEDKKAESKDSNNQEKQKKKQKDMSEVICWACNKPGHYCRDCPEEVDELKSSHATWKSYSTTAHKYAKHEVILDNASEVSVINSCLLTDIKVTEETGFAGLGGQRTRVNQSGLLRDFFECLVCDHCQANILSQSQVEDIYEITYVPGDRYVVHMDERDLEFIRRGRVYVADMSDWVVKRHHRVHATAEIEAGKYTKKEMERAQQAQELIRNSGYPSEIEAAHMASDGNIAGVPVTAADVHRAYELFGPPVEAVRGKTTRKKVTRDSADITIRRQRTEQTLYVDVMKVGNQPFLISLVEPLQLLLVNAIQRETTERIGQGLQQHLATLRARGFRPTCVRMEPQPAMAALTGQFGEVEIDISGAGDHLDKLDIRIRRVKEVIRSVHSTLKWKLPEGMIKDIVIYAVNRVNMRRTSASGTNVAPRVAFTGRRPNYRKEYGLGFGDYCECYNPTCTSNNALEDRTEPCIALYPSTNENGTWIFLNMKTKKYIRRTSWTKMVTTDLVVQRMDELAGVTSVPILADEDMEAKPDMCDAKENEDRPQVEMHEVPATDTDIGPDEGVAVIVETNVLKQDDNDEKTVELNTDATQQATRQSARIAAGVRKPEKLTLHTSVQKALKENGKDAYEAIKDELTMLFVKKRVLIPVRPETLSVQDRQRILRSSMFLKTKHDALGNFEKIKARLVADGRDQDRTLYGDYSSPTARTESVMACLYLAARENQKLAKVDITGAYLNAEMKGVETYMRLDPYLCGITTKIFPQIKRFVRNRRLVVRLDKALYGCIQSARLWNEMLVNVIKSLGYTQCETDPCILTKAPAGRRVTLVIFVDDILILADRDEEIDELIKELKNKFNEIKFEKGNDLSYLGMHVSVANGVAEIGMEAFIKDLIADFGATRACSTPAKGDLFETNESRLLNEKIRKIFHSTVAKLLYLGKRVRPDILVAVTFLCTRVQHATEEDYAKLERLMGYLKETSENKLYLDGSGPMELTGFIDAAFGTHTDGKSHSGLVISVGGCSIASYSRKQKIVTKSSTEAELVALSDLMLEVEKCRELFQELGYDVGTPILAQDNKSTISLVTRGGGIHRSKHLRVRQNLIMEKFKNNEVKINYCPTHLMTADILTKPLQGALFLSLKNKLMGRPKTNKIPGNLNLPLENRGASGST